MFRYKCRIFGLLLYKNFLVRKRYWKSALFLEIFATLFMFLGIWALRNLVPQRPYDKTIGNNTVYRVKSAKDYVEDLKTLLVVPDNQFTKNLARRVQKCLRNRVSTINFDTEEKMNEAQKTNQTIHEAFGLIFEDKNVNYSTKNLRYKIELPWSLPRSLYSESTESMTSERDTFDNDFTGLLLCVDQSLIQIKKNDMLQVQIRTQRMPEPAQAVTNILDTNIKRAFAGFAVSAFIIPLSIETAHASKEKFLGINVLMAMNGVPNYLNLLSWLVSALIFSMFYIMPIVLLLTLYTTEEVPISFIHYTNPFIFWLLLVLNIAHLVTFGMHISAYFTRSLFMNTGLLILYVGATVLQQNAFKDTGLSAVPFLGVLFPNLLLFRGLEEINYYEDIRKGVNFGNMFSTANRNYGIQGSMGMVLILSAIGIILHFSMANYVYAMNPGKYGVRKGPFYFLKCLKRKKKLNEQSKVESFEFTDVSGQPFEPVTDGTHTPGIQIRNLKKLYRTSLFSQTRVYALRGVSVDFLQGQITALLGHNGAGKTTMMSILSGMIGPTEGLVLVNGKNVKDEIDEIMYDTGLCPQENMLFPQLSVFEQMRLFAMLKSKNKTMPVTDTEVAQLLSQLKLLDKQNAMPNELSGGQKRRVCLGMALVGDSSTLILDEPTSGLDPESKRDIWNVLLRMKGRKTILISTHDMEEADVLGDRIAIMHMGQLKSYGTPMFLKKFMGGGNIEVTLSTEPRCNTIKVCTFLDEGSQVIADELGKIVLNVPNNSRLPESLDELEENKKELGITGISVSVITLEKVFLKVVEDNADTSKTRQPFSLTTEKLTSDKQFLQRWRGLISKKATYSLKNISTIIATLALLIVASFLTIFTLMDHTSSTSEEIPLKRDMYHNVEDFYKIYSNSKAYGDTYKKLVEESDATLIQYQSRENLTEVLLKIGTHDMSDYYYRHIVGAEFASRDQLVNAIAMYNSKFARFAQPLSINLVSNAILKTVTNDNSSIEISVQETPEMDGFVITPTEIKSVDVFMLSIMFVFFLYPAIAFFVVHPIRETLTNIKHLQRMTGVSCFSYWGTMFLFDFLLLFYMIVCLVIGFVVADRALNIQMFGITEAFILLALLTLFAINVLPLVYIFSFWGQSTTAAMKLLSLVPLGLVLVEIVMFIVKSFFEDHNSVVNVIRPLQKAAFLLIPYISFFHGQISFFNSSRINQECKKLYQYNKYQICLSASCCDMKCEDDTCENAVSYFREFSEEISLSTSFLALCLTPILYFTVLGILEYKVIEKFNAKRHSGIPDNTDATFEEQVKNVKREIAYEVSKLGIEGVDTGKYQSNADNETEEVEENGNFSNHVFLVYELRKLYDKFIAVQDISFGVNESECFGLLGVNGAGKSTTFKMMTGEIISNHGVIHLRDKNSRNDQNKNYLNNLGYCPQNDAIIRSLNSYDHLRLFARIRGIPENKVEEEVQNWIDKLNLNVCALQPSGTYSGGNKRRLNIAMSLIGVPNLVLLDEPTTGVDPAARRSLWNTIQSCQAMGQAVILTSHSMEECEALCNRLAIMVDGKFVCIGPPTELKQRFGAGYDVQIQMNPEKSRNEIDGIKQDLIGALPCEVVDENSGYLKCHVLSANITWRQMHNVMIGLKDNYSCILDYSVLSSTLEQLFLIFAKTANKTNRRTI